MTRGNLFIVSAPSGAGKTSLLKRLRTELEGIVISISHTTRPQRPGEIHGRDYYFVSQKEFEKMLAEGAFLEHAKVFGHYYGTSRRVVTESLEKGVDVILEIDWQGARQVKEKMPESRSIFILPPSRAVLRERLCSRGQDSPEIIARRMREAKAEISHYEEYDYLVVNDEFEQAVVALKSIVVCHRLILERQQERLAVLLKNLLA